MAKATPLRGLTRRKRVSKAGPSLIATRLADVVRFEALVPRTLDQDAIHDMRVAARRLRAALQFLDADVAVEEGVKRLQDALGGVRDVQVQGRWLEARIGKVPARDRLVLESMRQRLDAQVPARSEGLRDELDRWRKKTAPRVRASARGKLPRRRLGGHHSAHSLRRGVKKLERRLRAFDDSKAPIIAHRARIAAKKLRYEAELLEPIWPTGVGLLLRALIPLQDDLGALHDADVRLSLIEQLSGGTARPGAVTRLVGSLERERERLVRAAERRIAAWRRRSLRRALDGSRAT